MSLPAVTSIYPSSGPTAGGTSVTITGTNFTEAIGVTIGGADATDITVNSGTSITCTTPAGSAGTASVVVSTDSGHNANNSLFTYGPTVTSISPPSGLPSGGTAVTIIGTNFSGATDVTIGGVSVGSFTETGGTKITCTTPVGIAGAASVEVTAPYGTNAANTLYTYGPKITSIYPASGLPSGGTSVTITGIDFAGTTSVTFGGVAATSVTLSDDKTTITCTTPASSLGSLGSVSVIVTATIGSNASNSLFTYAPAPTVSETTPTSGSTLGGTHVTITGTDFIGATGVTFGDVPATGFSLVSETSITCITSPGWGPGTVSVVVTTPSGASSGSVYFTNVSPPTVTSVSPPSGLPAGGAAVTITGTNFTGATSVTFGGVAADIHSSNSTTIECITPAGSSAVSVLVTTLGGTNAANTLFTYQQPPAVTSLSPPLGVTTGGAIVTLTGANFIGASSVTFGGVAATGVTVVNATTITCTTPAGSAGTASVVVATDAGMNEANSLYFYVLAAPTDTYVYLKGGRGDGFVPLWIGTLAEEGMVSDTGTAVGAGGREVSEPYRDIHNYSTSIRAGAQTPGGLVVSTGDLDLNGTALVPGSATPQGVTGLIVGATGLPADGLLSGYISYGPGPVSSAGLANVVLTNVTPQVSDEVAHEKPRQYARVSTWLIFTSQNGLPYKFRKDSVLGWGSKPRSE